MSKHRISLVVIGLLMAAVLVIPLVVHAAVDDAYTVALLHMDGTDASTAFIDESGKTWTGHAHAQIDTAQSKLGGASGQFDGTDDYINGNGSSDFAFGTGNFTIDFWVRLSNTTTAVFYDGRGTGQNQPTYQLIYESSGILYYHDGDVAIITGTTTMSTNVWHHIAVARSGTSTKMFLDGTQEGSTYTDTIDYVIGADRPSIGMNGYNATNFLNGWVDELRISKGIARWTSNFTPPAAQYQPTPTPTATNTFTATGTLWTLTPTDTPTATYTPTATNTPSPTITPTPGPAVIWAPGPVTLSTALHAAIEAVLMFRVPDEAQTNIYSITSISGVDTDWMISLVNLVGVESPYEVWNMEDNADWAWSVECLGAEPTWSCDYYVLPASGGGSSMRWPWKTGYSAQYGIMGVHTGAQMVPGSSAIDLLGRDSDTDTMPPLVVAAANGTITSICSDGVSMAIRVDGGPVPLAYFHFDTGQSFVVGQTVSQGQVLGQLRYGSFDGPSCGYAIQQSDQYHIHFVFMPTTPGYLEIGGCVLDMSTRAIVCNGNTYGTLDYIPNGGDTSNSNNPTPAPGENPTTFAGGGAHIWDGIVDAFVQLSSNTLNQYLPDQPPLISYVVQKVTLVIQAFLGSYGAFMSYGFSWVFLGEVLSTFIGMELGLLVFQIAWYSKDAIKGFFGK